MDNICESLKALEFDESQATLNYKDLAESSDEATAKILTDIAEDEARHEIMLRGLQKTLACKADEAEKLTATDVPPETMERWASVEFGPGGECRPCRMAPAASLYLGVLEKEKMVDAAKELNDAYESENILTLAKSMDNIKAHAGEHVKAKLIEIDSFAQNYQSDEDQED